MSPVRLEKAASLRATVRILAWILFVITGIKQLRVYLDKSGEVSANLGVVGLPTTLLIDREGREIGRKIGPAEWDGPEVVRLIQSYVEMTAPLQSRNR